MTAIQGAFQFRTTDDIKSPINPQKAKNEDIMSSFGLLKQHLIQSRFIQYQTAFNSTQEIGEEDSHSRHIGFQRSSPQQQKELIRYERGYIRVDKRSCQKSPKFILDNELFSQNSLSNQGLYGGTQELLPHRSEEQGCYVENGILSPQYEYDCYEGECCGFKSEVRTECQSQHIEKAFIFGVARDGLTTREQIHELLLLLSLILRLLVVIIWQVANPMYICHLQLQQSNNQSKKRTQIMMRVLILMSMVVLSLSYSFDDEDATFEECMMANCGAQRMECNRNAQCGSVMSECFRDLRSGYVRGSQNTHEAQRSLETCFGRHPLGVSFVTCVKRYCWGKLSSLKHGF